MAFDLAVAGVTLTGSLLSAVASLCVLACFVYFNQSQRSFRHALVFNLTLADFLNATNNSISGIIYVRDNELFPSSACSFNGWLGQLSVQATDFSMLAISLATLLVVTQTGRITNASTLAKTIMCLSVWIMPVVTSTTALAMGEMAPVSGNWCWISPERPDLRYALGHGWRFAIMAITIFTYTYVWFYITRHFKSLANLSSTPNTGPQLSVTQETPSWLQRPGTSSTPQEDGSIDLGNMDSHDEGRLVPDTKPMQQQDQGIKATTTITTTTTTRVRIAGQEEPGLAAKQHHASASRGRRPHPDHFNARSRQVERDVKKMLLLNGYPICYVILWIPGITNRIMEASGGATGSRVLAILQASTQYIGFANALTYGLNQQWRR